MPGTTEGEAQDLPTYPKDETALELLSRAVARAKEQGISPLEFLLVSAEEHARLCKPGDRSEKDRWYAVLRTELEKLVAYAAHYGL